MTPDPVFDTLTRFTPDSTGIDAGTIMFAAGKASARTHVAWKFAVGVLLLTNVAVVAALFFQPNTDSPLPAEPVVIPVVIPIPTHEPNSIITITKDQYTPWTIGALSRFRDLDQLPGPDVGSDIQIVSAPLTPLSVRGTSLD